MTTFLDLESLATTFVRTVEHHAEIGSTNDRARELGATAELPALVVADRQTRGRGRGGNRWWSGDGALLFSLVFDGHTLNLPSERRPLVALATGLATRAAVAGTCPPLEPRLKWPNDVLLADDAGRDRKLCGILVEEADGRIVVGVGLNANNSFRAADSPTTPADVAARAISIVDALGSAVDRHALLRSILVELEQELALVGDESSRIDRRWAPHCALSHAPVAVRVHERLVEGVAAGIDDGGALLVHTATGLERITSGVVERFG